MLSFRRLISPSHTYIPEIDGLRFIAIASVLIFHVWYTVQAAAPEAIFTGQLAFLADLLARGARGVQLFFVISGFILALPFAAQHLTSAREVSLRRFYLRRLTRLEPPYILVLCGVYFLAVLLQTPDTQEEGFATSFLLRLFYLYGIVFGTHPNLNGVTWSLEVEVQFYLLAPFLCLVFKLPVAVRRSLLVGMILIFSAFGRSVPHGSVILPGSLQYFLVGLLLADFYLIEMAGRAAKNVAMDFLGWSAVFGVFFFPVGIYYNLLLPWFMGGIFLTGLTGRFARIILSHPWVTNIGGMCYSIYLLHYPLLSLGADRLVQFDLNGWRLFLVALLTLLPAALLISAIFYLLVERPCMDPDWPAKFRRALSCPFLVRNVK